MLACSACLHFHCKNNIAVTSFYIQGSFRFTARHYSLMLPSKLNQCHLRATGGENFCSHWTSTGYTGQCSYTICPLWRHRPVSKGQVLHCTAAYISLGSSLEYETANNPCVILCTAHCMEMKWSNTRLLRDILLRIMSVTVSVCIPALCAGALKWPHVY